MSRDIAYKILDEDETPYCLNCGAVIFSERVCPSCGTDIATNENIRDKKIQEYEEQLLKDPNNTEILLKKANLLARKGDVISEIKCFKKILEIEPNNVDAWLRTGIAFAYLANTSETYKPQVLEDLKNAGISIFHPQLFEDAAMYFDKVFDFEPDNFDALYHKGRLHSRLDQNKYALVLFERAFEIDPQHVRLLFDIAHLHYRTKNYEKTIEWLEKVLEINPIHKQALDIIILSLYFKQRYTDVIHYCDKLLEFDPDDHSAKEHKKHALEALSSS